MRSRRRLRAAARCWNIREALLAVVCQQVVDADDARHGRQAPRRRCVDAPNCSAPARHYRAAASARAFGPCALPSCSARAVGACIEAAGPSEARSDGPTRLSAPDAGDLLVGRLTTRARLPRGVRGARASGETAARGARREHCVRVLGHGAPPSASQDNSQHAGAITLSPFWRKQHLGTQCLTLAALLMYIPRCGHGLPTGKSTQGESPPRIGAHSLYGRLTVALSFSSVRGGARHWVRLSQ